MGSIVMKNETIGVQKGGLENPVTIGGVAEDVLNEIKELIFEHESAYVLRQVRNRIAKSKNPSFAWFYGAVVARYCGDNDLFINLLNNCRDSYVADGLIRVLQNGTEEIALPITERSWQGVKEWHKTNIAKRHRAISIEAIVTRLRNSGGNSNKIISLFDYGVGGGEQIVGLVNRLSEEGISDHINLVLVDELKEATEDARRYCEANLSCSYTLRIINGDVRNIQQGFLEEATGDLIVNASACLHEIPVKDKLEVIRKVVSAGGRLFLSELEGNHDIEDDLSPERLFSIQLFYEGLLGAIRKDNVKARLAVDKFLLIEVMQSISSPYEKRKNYHMLLGQWEKLGKDLNFWAERLFYGSVDNEPPALMCLEYEYYI